MSGTFGIQVPRDYSYYLEFVSITDGNKIIGVRNYGGFWGEEFTSWSVYPSGESGQAGPDWHFYILKGITLESEVVQLTFEYVIGYGLSDNRKDLERGTEVFSVNVE